MLLPLTLISLVLAGSISAQNPANQGKPKPPGIAGRYGSNSRPSSNTYGPDGKPCNCPENEGGSHDFGNPEPLRPSGDGEGSNFGNPDPYKPNGGGGGSDFGNPDPYKPNGGGGGSDFGNPDPYKPNGGGGGSDFGNPDPYKPKDDYPNDGDAVIDGGAQPLPKPHGGEYVPPPDDPTAGEDYVDTGAGGGGGGGSTDYVDHSGNPAGGGSIPADCDCVPYYQCKDGDIITDGSGIIDPRKKPTPKEEMPLEDNFPPHQCGKYHVCCSSSSRVTEKPYEHFCGVRKPGGVNTRILNHGKKGESQFGEWPWQGAVLKVEGEANHFKCGGVLIDQYHVLTVAHCVAQFVDPGAPVTLIVRLGEWDTQTKTEFLPHEDYVVNKIIVHEAFRNNSLWNDIAVLKLNNPVKFSPHIDSICLPNYGEKHVGEKCVVTGWGKNAYRGGSYSNVLREVHVPIIDNHQCQELLRKTRLGKYFRLHDGFMCAGGDADEDSCKGDGGGPLVCYRADGTYSLTGLVSWGIDCGQPYVPGVYMDVTKYLDWIKEVTGQPLDNYWPKV